MNEVCAVQHRIEVRSRYNGGKNSDMHWIETLVHHAGASSITDCCTSRLYFVHGQVSPPEVRRLAAELLADPVSEVFIVTPVEQAEVFPGVSHSVEVVYHPGVTDPAAESLVHAAHSMGIMGIDQAATGQRYLLSGDIDQSALERLAAEAFSNPLIQHTAVDKAVIPPFSPNRKADDTVRIIPLREADDEALLKISTKRGLALNLSEMRAIQEYFQAEERDPADVELEMIAQTWSEHCSHKTFQALIEYTGPLPGADPYSKPVAQTIDGVLNTAIRAVTKTLNRPWVLSAFVDNAGIIAFNDEWDLAFKVETHNHPSALEPFGGANTGVGGVIRDILGVSARPIANTDTLCFGPPSLSTLELQPGVLHPRRISEGVIHGIGDYGNKMGIPTVNGAVLYHSGYTANPLVYCGCLGLLPHNSHPTALQPGDSVVVIGGRTGRDGLRGATFSSMEMNQDTGEISGGAVQIGHPINEKQVMEAVVQARDEGLYTAITDCGAGGLSSAVGELGRKVGVRIQIERIPLKYTGLRPWEIWLSEAQERMVLAVPPKNLSRLREVCAVHSTEMVCIGEFESTGRITLFSGKKCVADMGMEFLHDGRPPRRMTAFWQPPPLSDTSSQPVQTDMSSLLLKILSHPNIHSKEDIISRYDYEVQGGTAVKPLTGSAGHGPGDASVLVPLDTHLGISSETVLKGVSLAVGICPQFTEFDPYAMAWAAVDEAFRNLTAVGTDPGRVALLDNFCWGDPAQPDELGSLVRCAQGCHDAALAYEAPFISGKDSLNNEFIDHDGRRHAIPGTLLISAVGIVPDIERTVTMDFKSAGNLIIMIGETRDEMGGSHYNQVARLNSGAVPRPNPAALQTLKALHGVISSGWVSACHDCSEGGLAVAVAEMCLGGQLGASIQLGNVPHPGKSLSVEQLLFSETLTRFIVEADPSRMKPLTAALSAIPHAVIGRVIAEPVLDVYSSANDLAVHLSLSAIETAWRGESAVSRPRPPSQESTIPEPAALHLAPKVCILHVRGTNRDRDAFLACMKAGGAPQIVFIEQLLDGSIDLADFHMLVLPGGFSYGDDLGAGALWALQLKQRLDDDIRRFTETGRPVLGICNGFQALLKAGLLPGGSIGGQNRQVTLTANESRRFECRWVTLKGHVNSRSLFLDGSQPLIFCPAAHAEGRLAARDQAALDQLCSSGMIALTYVDESGHPVSYPGNPNGSSLDIAGLCNPQGNVLGLMPHPENHIFPWQNPLFHRFESRFNGLTIFRNGIKNA